MVRTSGLCGTKGNALVNALRPELAAEGLGGGVASGVVLRREERQLFVPVPPGLPPVPTARRWQKC